MSKPQNNGWISLKPPKLAHYGPKLKFRIEGNIDNKNCSSISVDPKQCLNQTPTSQIGHFGPKKAKATPNLGYIQKKELMES